MEEIVLSRFSWTSSRLFKNTGKLLYWYEHITNRSAHASSTLFCLIPCPFLAYDAIWKKSRLNVNLSLCAEIIQIGALNFRNSCRWSNVCHGCSTVIDSISYQPHACLLCTINCTIPLRPRTGATNVYMWQLEATVMMINAPLPPHTHTPTSH